VLTPLPLLSLPGPSRKFVGQSYLTGPIAGELLGDLA
jgi:hypothetical protein